MSQILFTFIILLLIHTSSAKKDDTTDEPDYEDITPDLGSSMREIAGTSLKDLEDISDYTSNVLDSDEFVMERASINTAKKDDTTDEPDYKDRTPDLGSSMREIACTSLKDLEDISDHTSNVLDSDEFVMERVSINTAKKDDTTDEPDYEDITPDLGSSMRGAAVTHIDVFTPKLEGSRLYIPCMFFVDKALDGNAIQLEWSMTPDNGDNYHSIIVVDDTKQLPESQTDGRAQLRLSHLHTGDCSLIIDPVANNDSGTYELQFSLDGIPYVPIPHVDIWFTDNNGEIEIAGTSLKGLEDISDHTSHVLDKKDDTTDKPDYEDRTPDLAGMIDEITPVPDVTLNVAEENVVTPFGWNKGSMVPIIKHLNSSQVLNEEEGSHHPLDSQNISPQAMWYDKFISHLKKTGRFQIVLICGGIIIFVLVLGSVVGCIYGCWYFRLKRKKKDDINATEEG